jgi:hypothetical protein
MVRSSGVLPSQLDYLLQCTGYLTDVAWVNQLVGVDGNVNRARLLANAVPSRAPFRAETGHDTSARDTVTDLDRKETGLSVQTLWSRSVEAAPCLCKRVVVKLGGVLGRVCFGYWLLIV